MTNRGGSDYGHALAVGGLDELLGQVLRNTFSNYCYDTELKKSKVSDKKLNYLTCGYFMVSMVASYAERNDAKLTRTFASRCFSAASDKLL